MGKRRAGKGQQVTSPCFWMGWRWDHPLKALLVLPSKIVLPGLFPRKDSRYQGGGGGVAAEGGRDVKLVVTQVQARACVQILCHNRCLESLSVDHNTYYCLHLSIIITLGR